MADFCKECARLLFGQEMPCDLHGITTQENWDKGLAASVICEGCGPIQVDPEGNCVSQGCLEEGKPGHGLPWKAGPTAPVVVTEATALQLTGKPGFDSVHVVHNLPRLVTDEPLNTFQELTDAFKGTACYEGESAAPGLSSPEGKTAADLPELVSVAVPAEAEPLYVPFEMPSITVQIEGRPLTEFRRASDRLLYTGTATPTGTNTMEYVTPAWPVPIVCSRYVDAGLVMYVFRPGIVPVPENALEWQKKAKQALRQLEEADPEGYAAFKAFHGNPVIYDPVRRVLSTDETFKQICGQILRTHYTDEELVNVVMRADGYDCSTLNITTKEVPGASFDPQRG